MGSWENGWSSDYDANLATYEGPWATSNPVNDNLSCGGNPYATWTPKPGAHENLPMNCVDWYDAYAFCIWDGGFLPSEAEWEYASAGGDEQREYPWGSADPGEANHYAIYGCLFPSASGACSDLSNVAPVGTASQGAGKWGQLDLAGNVFEWTLDYWYQQYQSPCVDCAALTLTSTEPFPTRSSRGSAFERTGTGLLSPWYHSYESEMDRSPYTGIRCARTP